VTWKKPFWSRKSRDWAFAKVDRKVTRNEVSNRPPRYSNSTRNRTSRTEKRRTEKNAKVVFVFFNCNNWNCLELGLFRGTTDCQSIENKKYTLWRYNIQVRILDFRGWTFRVFVFPEVPIANPTSDCQSERTIEPIFDWLLLLVFRPWASRTDEKEIFEVRGLLRELLGTERFQRRSSSTTLPRGGGSPRGPSKFFPPARNRECSP
jgi:hypothetical protein